MRTLISAEDSKELKRLYEQHALERNRQNLSKRTKRPGNLGTGLE
jgi:hypothetical protein